MTSDPNPYAALETDAAPSPSVIARDTHLLGDDIDRIHAMAKTMRIVGIFWCVFAVVAFFGSMRFSEGWITSLLAMAPLAMQGVLLSRAAKPMRRSVRKGRAQTRSLVRAVGLLRWVFVMSTLASLFIAASTFISRIVEPRMTRAALEKTP